MDERDHPWIRLLLEEYKSFDKRPRHEFRQRLEQPFPFENPTGKRKFAQFVLDKLGRDEIKAILSPRRARSAVFMEATRSIKSRADILSNVAQTLKINPMALDDSLFADLPGERILNFQSLSNLSIQEFTLRANLDLIKGFLFRASSIEIELFGNSRPVVRHAKLHGLICTVAGNNPKNFTTVDDANICLNISGPYSIFRRTLLYGRALGELVPFLQNCNSYKLAAKVHLGEREFILKLQSGDPILPAQNHKSYDSLIEERFALQFRKLATEWDLIREPNPIEASGTLIFPDFLIKHRFDHSQVWFFEIIGFWTADYLSKKLERLQKAKISNLILCINEKLNCTLSEGLVESHKVIFFKNKIDPAAVLKVIQQSDIEYLG